MNNEENMSKHGIAFYLNNKFIVSQNDNEEDG